MTRAEVVLQSEGSIILFHLLSPRAERWVTDNVDPSAQWFAGALVVEHRFAGDLASALQREGITVEVLS